MAQTIVSRTTGEPIDERGPVKTEHYAPIHAEAPDFVEMSVEQDILVTGIKVVDLLAPYSKGGKIGERDISLLRSCLQLGRESNTTIISLVVIMLFVRITRQQSGGYRIRFVNMT